MKICGQEYDFQEVSNVLTVPDCVVANPNKLGSGNGEAKFYFGSREALEAFTLGEKTIHCFFAKADLLRYMRAIQGEYANPTQPYRLARDLPRLWADRMAEVEKCPEIIEFTADVQTQIAGPRGYLNSPESGYRLFRKLSLPLVSYISIMRLMTPQGKSIFYWRLFVDFQALAERKRVALVYNYGCKKAQPAETPREQPPPIIPAEEPSASRQREGRDAALQAKYRAGVLAACPFCPITRITDERLLIASHIKPLAVSTESEAYDPKNGFALSPLYDKLFDSGFISFDSGKRLMVSNWLSPSNQACCQLKAGAYIQMLPLDSDRESYLEYHRAFVFKG